MATGNVSWQWCGSEGNVSWHVRAGPVPASTINSRQSSWVRSSGLPDGKWQGQNFVWSPLHFIFLQWGFPMMLDYRYLVSKVSAYPEFSLWQRLRLASQSVCEARPGRRQPLMETRAGARVSLVRLRPLQARLRPVRHWSEQLIQRDMYLTCPVTLRPTQSPAGNTNICGMCVNQLKVKKSCIFHRLKDQYFLLHQVSFNIHR